MTWDPLPPAITSKTNSSILGLNAADGPLVLVQLSVDYEESSNDALITSVTSDLINRINNAAKERGLHNDFVFLNYAVQGQDPLTGYGAENVEKLKAVSRKYDPDQVFLRQVPGGFKLFV